MESPNKGDLLARLDAALRTAEAFIAIGELLEKELSRDPLAGAAVVVTDEEEAQ
jgi:hypothetical protein